MDAEPNTAVGPPNASESPQRGLIEYTHWIYALHSLSVLSALFTTRAVALRFVFGLPSIIAVIMNYARRSETHGTWLESHFRWQIRTFWFALLWVVVTALVSVPLMIILIGVYVAYLGTAITGLWVIYRVVRGWITLTERRPLPMSVP